MKSLEEVLESMQDNIDRKTLENYIERKWLQPEQQKSSWYFEDIDIARLELICHLTQEINVNEDGMDVVLSLLDQLYSTRNSLNKLHNAISSQPEEVQSQIILLFEQP